VTTTFPALEENLLGIPYPESGTVELFSGVARMAGKIWAREVRPAHTEPRTAVVLVHPTSNFLGHFALEPLARAGFAAIGLTTRYVGNDSQALLENTLIDVGAAVGYLRQRGYDKVVLVGYSGGGAIVPWYQREAVDPVTTSAPCGGGPDLTKAGLPPADGIMLMSAHPSRALMMRDWLDPAITDEHDAYTRDRSLDMFDPVNGPPYASDWLEEYRAAQLERMDRITRWCRSELERLSGLGADAPTDRAFVVHGTVADPGFLDLSIQPNDRPLGTYWGSARSSNLAPLGPARYCSTRSWLSNWDVNTTNADARKHLKSVHVPVLLLNGTADQGIRDYHTQELWRAVVADDRELVAIPGGDHYFSDLAIRETALAAAVHWLRNRDFQ
jgi:alpha-beta hydrolase superfamily lysophospholipase